MSVLQPTVLGMIAVVLATFVCQWVWGRQVELDVWEKLGKVPALPDGYEIVVEPKLSAQQLTIPAGTKLSLPPGTTVTESSGVITELEWVTHLAPLDGADLTLTVGSVVSQVNIIWGPSTKPMFQKSRPYFRPPLRRLPKGELQAFRWGLECTYWEEEARRIRQSFLARTQATAEKWRNVFAGLLGVFGAVLFLKPALPQGAMGKELYALIIGALIFAAQAVAYTGWAGAGMPKQLVDVTASKAFCKQTSHAARSLVRLRVGLIMGGGSVLALILAVAIVLSAGM